MARVGAAALLLFGPWTDAAAELQGWDVERFVAIAEAGQRLWSELAVEYPPGSVIVFKLLQWVTSWMFSTATSEVVGFHRILVVLTLVADLTLAWLLARRSPNVGRWYLTLGLPLLPMGLLRLDLIVSLLAVMAVLLGADADRGRRSWSTSIGTAVVIGTGGLIAAAVMVKIWPALLIPALWAVGRERAAVAAVAMSGLATAVWLAWAGAGIEPLQQVVDLRGATGWHLESLGGVATSLADAVGLWPLSETEGPRLELNAFRTGTLNGLLVGVCRAMAVVTIMALTLRARSRLPRSNNADQRLAVVGTVMLGSIAALLVSSPLLSPQFLLWLAPWAALGMLGDDRPLNRSLVLTLAAATITGITLATFGPPNLAEPLPAAALAIRNLVLIAVSMSCWRQLGTKQLLPTARGQSTVATARLD